MKFVAYKPAFVTTDVNLEIEDASLSEILNHPWLQKWATNGKRFQFAYSEYQGEEWPKALLMGVWIDQWNHVVWHVIGYLSQIPNELSKWDDLRTDYGKIETELQS